MLSADRAAPHITLGILTLLAVAALVLSLSTAPPNAEQQLRTAAANTAGASSFVLTDVETAGPVPTKGAAASPTREQAVIVYQAPDRVQETVTASGRTASVLVVGSHRYERSANGKWYDLGPSASGSTAGPSAGSVAAQDILFPLKSLSKATNVIVSREVYAFVPDQPVLFLDRLIGTAVPASETSYAATVEGEFLHEAEVVIRQSGEQVTVLLALSHIQDAPALAAPSASQLTRVPPSP